MKLETLFFDFVPAADSNEIQQQYFIDRICALEERMSSLTLQEHPHEIVRCCDLIIELKRVLKKKFGNPQ